MEIKSIVSALSALAQESRLTIFRLLVQAGPTGLPAGKISEATGIAPSSLSFHLKEMSHASMVTSRQEGRLRDLRSQLSDHEYAHRLLTENCCQGEPCMPEGQACAVGDVGCERSNH